MIKINEPQLPWLRTAIYHTGLDVKWKSPNTHDAFLPIPGVISCTGVTGSGRITCHAHVTLDHVSFSGRYGEDFVEKRRQKLQMWSNRIARHPVLSRSEVIAHFFLCDDDGGVSGGMGGK